jgi:hypothetical protein
MGIWIQQDYFRHGTCCSSIYKELIDRIARHGKKDPGPWLGVLLLDADDAIAGLWEPAWNPMATCINDDAGASPTRKPPRGVTVSSPTFRTS